MKYLFVILLCPQFCFSQSHDSIANGVVKISGAMHRVMQRGELFGTIDLDTLKSKDHLYGLGPSENLKGEILIWDGKSHFSTIQPDLKIKVDSGFNVRAPFFVYSNVSQWKEFILPDSILSDSDLENYLVTVSSNFNKPFAFKFITTIDSARIHVVNLPDGKKVSAAKDAHVGQMDLTIRNKDARVLGFFSTQHQGVFTHHSSYIHMHLMTGDEKSLGHVDSLHFGNKPTKIYLSFE